MDVQSRHRHDHPTTDPVIYCDKEEDCGCISVDPNSLRQWRFSRLQLVRFLAKQLGFENPLLGRAQTACRLGTIRRKKGRHAVAVQFADTVVFTLGEGRRDVWELLTFDGEQLSLNHEEIVALADTIPEVPPADQSLKSSPARELRKKKTQERDVWILREGRRLKRRHRWTTTRISVELEKQIKDRGNERQITAARVRRILGGKI